MFIRKQDISCGKIQPLVRTPELADNRKNANTYNLRINKNGKNECHIAILRVHIHVYSNVI